MDHKKEVLLGTWAVIAIAAIVFFIVVVLNNMTTTGSYTASTAFLQYNPQEMCEMNNCESYLSDTVNMPIHLRSGPTATVNCLCRGEVKTFQLRQTNLGIYNPDYYPTS